MAVFAVLCWMTAWWLGLTPRSVDIADLGFSSLISAAATWTLGRRPMFVKCEEAMDPLNQSIGVWIYVLGLIVFFAAFGVLSADWPRADTHSNVSVLSCIATVAYAMAVLAILLFHTSLSRDSRLLSMLLKAPPLPKTGVLPGRFGSFEGIVRDPSPVVAHGEASAMAHIIDETIQPGSDPNIKTERILTEGSFYVRGENGFEYDVHPKGGVWSSSVRIRTPVNKKRKFQLMQIIPIGASILVAGHALREKKSRSGKIRAREEAAGADARETPASAFKDASLLFFSADRGGNARKEAHALLSIRRLAIAVIALSGVAAIGLAIFAEPNLPPFNVAPSPVGDAD